MSDEQARRMSDAEINELIMYAATSDIRDDPMVVDLMQVVHQKRTDLAAAREQLADAREALEPFFRFAKNNACIGPENRPMWCGLRCEGERIVDWFGPTDFVRLRQLEERLAPLAAKSEESSS